MDLTENKPTAQDMQDRARAFDMKAQGYADAGLRARLAALVIDQEHMLGVIRAQAERIAELEAGSAERQA